MLRRHGFITFLVSMAMAFTAVAACISMSAGDLKPRQERIINVCVLGAIFSLGYARMEYVSRKTKHDLRNDLNKVSLTTQAALHEVPEQVVKKINGGLERAADKIVDKKLDESPFPTTRADLEAFVRSVQSIECRQMAEEAADLAVAKYIRALNGGVNP